MNFVRINLNLDDNSSANKPTAAQIFALNQQTDSPSFSFLSTISLLHLYLDKHLPFRRTTNKCQLLASLKKTLPTGCALPLRLLHSCALPFISSSLFLPFSVHKISYLGKVRIDSSNTGSRLLSELVARSPGSSLNLTWLVRCKSEPKQKQKEIRNLFVAK